MGPDLIVAIDKIERRRELFSYDKHVSGKHMPRWMKDCIEQILIEDLKAPNADDLNMTYDRNHAVFAIDAKKGIFYIILPLGEQAESHGVAVDQFKRSYNVPPSALLYEFRDHSCKLAGISFRGKPHG